MFTFAFKCLTLCTGENCVSSNMNVDERMQFEATILTKTIPCLSSANNITASAKRCSKRVREPVPEKRSAEREETACPNFTGHRVQMKTVEILQHSTNTQRWGEKLRLRGDWAPILKPRLSHKDWGTFITLSKPLCGQMVHEATISREFLST